MHFKYKTKIREEALEFACLLEKGANRFQLLRAYNLWYTRALEFVSTHAKCRQNEFEERHAVNQAMLCDLNCRSFESLKINLMIQVAIIDASVDHSYHLV